MIKSFADKHTEDLFLYKKSRRLPSDIKERAMRKLELLDIISRLQELKINAGNQLEKLKGDYAGKYSIRINNQFRIVFYFEDGNAYEVEIIDYHK